MLEILTSLATAVAILAGWWWVATRILKLPDRVSNMKIPPRL